MVAFPRGSRRRAGRWLVPVALLALLGGLAAGAWRLSLPLRFLASTGTPTTEWEAGRGSLTAGPVAGRIGGVGFEAREAVAGFHWIDLLLRRRMDSLVLADTEVRLDRRPVSLGEIDLSPLRSRLERPEWSFDRFEVTVNIHFAGSAGPPAVVRTDALRNEAGALEAAGTWTTGEGRIEFFARLGRDSLENGGTFRGSIDTGPDSGAGRPFFDEPLASVLGLFETVQVEGSVFLDSSWRFAEGIALLSGARGNPRPGGAGIRDLAVSSATVRRADSEPETRVLVEGRSGETEGLLGIEFRRRGDGPIRIDLTREGALVCRIFASGWRAGETATLVREGKVRREVAGALRESPDGGLRFAPDEPGSGGGSGAGIPGLFVVPGER